MEVDAAVKRFLPLLLLLAAGGAAAVFMHPAATLTNADFGIETYISATDMDGDGIDDQTDLLQGARDYVSTKPKYESRYYNTGYPDDGYGVCTDVVAFGMRSAGYDLQALVDEDIRQNPDGYDIQTPDRNIDFRRVRNLSVYFAHTAISLTCDLTDISAWQGGDIVIFPGHIGIVSERRNSRGIPLLIHHSSPQQLRYEEDVLGRREIIGHYRLS